MDCCPQCLVDYGSLLGDSSTDWTASTAQLLEFLTNQQRWEPDSARLDRLRDRLLASQAPLHLPEHREALTAGLSHDDPRVVAATLRRWGPAPRPPRGGTNPRNPGHFAGIEGRRIRY